MTHPNILRLARCCAKWRAGFLIVACLLPTLVGAQVSYSPQPINFGSIKLGQTSAVLSSTLTNTGTDTLKFCGPLGTAFPGCMGKSRMTDSVNFQYVTDNCSARPPGGSCVLQYRFAPKSVGPLTGANLIGTNHGLSSLNFTGVGVDTVIAPPPRVVVTSVAVAPITVTIAVGEFTVQLYGFRSFSDGRGGATVATLLWASSDTTVVKVTKGILLPVGPGTATITASDSSRTVSATSVVTVLPQRQITVFGQSVWTGSYTVPVSDSAGKITARLLLVVRAP